MGVTIPSAAGEVKESYEISNSLRFNDDDSASLSREFSTDPSDQKLTTISFWFKIGNITSAFRALYRFNDGSNTGAIYLRSGNDLQFAWDLSSGSLDVRPDGVFRDPSAWYHCHIKVDTTQGTAANRVIIHINGVERSYGTATYPNQNATLQHLSNGKTYYIGGSPPNSDYYFDGHITEFHVIDGQAKDYTDFGEFDDNGVWIPKRYTGTYGNNGFYLQFKQTGTSANSSGIGADTSGNDLHWTPSNLAANDVTTDTCTNNFCTLNSVDKDGHTNAEGNLEVSGDVVYGMQRGTIGASSGKWYFEARLDVYQGDTAIALANEDENVFTRFTGETTNSVGYLADGRFFYNSSATNYSSLSAGDIFQIAFDADSGKIWIGKNNTWQNSGDPANGSGQVQTVSWNFFLPAARTVNNNGNGKLHYNFGQDSSFAGASTAQNNSDGKYGDFYYAPPSGFYALCTKRLAEFG